MLIATAGHVDHGKTTLVKALTGVDCDTLAEEKLRGITIHLGFAQWTLSDQRDISVIDVPGHETLIRTMANGVSCLDSVLLVIDGRTGVMPQTREHLNICSLHGVEHGVIALTFADQCPDIDEAIRSIKSSLSGRLAHAFPIVPVSAPSGFGLDALDKIMRRRLDELSATSVTSSKTAFLPIDRVFHRAGFGTVVTGTLLEGSVHVQDTLYLMPGQREVRIRGLEVHGKSMEGVAGKTRLAVNLRDSGTPPCAGDWLVSEPILTTPKVFDAAIHWLPHATHALHRRRGLTIQAGLHRALADIRADGIIHAGQTGTARIRLDRPIPMLPRSRFILRDQRIPSHGTVIGGGTVLDTMPPRKRRADVRTALMHRPTEHAAILIRETGPHGLSTDELRKRVRHFHSAAEHHFEPTLLRQAIAELSQKIASHYEHDPYTRGVPISHLTSTPIDHESLKHGLNDGRLTQVGALIQCPERAYTIDPAITKLAQKLMRAIGRAGYTALTHDELAQRFPAARDMLKNGLQHLVDEERVIRIESFYFPVRELKRARSAVALSVSRGERLPVGWLKANLGTSRKYAIPIWNWLDKLGVTRRDGNVRTAGPKAEAYLK